MRRCAALALDLQRAARVRSVEERLGRAVRKLVRKLKNIVLRQDDCHLILGLMNCGGALLLMHVAKNFMLKSNLDNMRRRLITCAKYIEGIHES